jgi:hypothetical protein
MTVTDYNSLIYVLFTCSAISKEPFLWGNY